MVTKAKDVPWNEVEDTIDVLRQWLVEHAGAPAFEDAGARGRTPQRTDALVVAMQTLRFVQILDGTRLPAEDGAEDDAHVRAAEDALYRIFPVIAHSRGQILKAVEAERGRYRAHPELRAELQPEVKRETPQEAPGIELACTPRLDGLSPARGNARLLAGGS